MKKLTNLVYLDVSHNNLTDLAVYTFAPLNRLTVLDLSGNDLAEPTAAIMSQVVIHNTTVKKLDLSCNRLGPVSIHFILYYS